MCEGDAENSILNRSLFKTISHVQLIQKMRVPYSVWPRRLERLNGICQRKVTLLNEIANNKVAGAIVPVMAVHAHDALLRVRPALRGGALALSLTNGIDQLDELVDGLCLGGDLGHGREFVVVDAAALEAARVIHRLVLGDVNDVLDDMAPFLGEDRRAVHVVGLAERLDDAEDGLAAGADELGNGPDALPLEEVLDIPFALAREVLELPGEREALGDVLGKEIGYEAGESADCAWGVEERVVCRCAGEDDGSHGSHGVL